jgi:hypothetical protein
MRLSAGLGALAALSLVALAASDACAPSPTVEERGRKIWGAYCDQIRTCAPSALLGVFGGYAGCVQRGLDGIPPGLLDSSASCSDAEQDACVAAIGEGGCPPFNDWNVAELPLDPRTLPEPCARCSPLGDALIDAGKPDR